MKHKKLIVFHVFSDIDHPIFNGIESNTLMYDDITKPLNVPCIPTNSKSKLELTIVQNDGNYKTFTKNDEGVKFDPRRGFDVDHRHLNFLNNYVTCSPYLFQYTYQQLKFFVIHTHPHIAHNYPYWSMENKKFYIECEAILPIDEQHVTMWWSYINNNQNVIKQLNCILHLERMHYIEC